MEISIDAQEWRAGKLADGTYGDTWVHEIVKVSIIDDSVGITLERHNDDDISILIDIKKLEWAIAKLRESQELGFES
jgi:hypothetical protein